MRLKLLGHSANDLFWFILPLVLPVLLIKYDLSFTQAGGLLTVYLTVTALCSFIIGKLSDRFSRRNILSYGFILASAGLISAAFAPSLFWFIICISLTAVGVSTFHPVMYAVIDETYALKKGRVMGLYESYGTAAILLMFLINGFLIKSIGVRGVLILTALPALVMGLIYRFSQVIPLKMPVQNKSEENSVPLNENPRDLRRFLLFLLSVILRVMSITAILNFLPTIFVSFFGLAENTAAYGTAFFFGGGIVGSILAGKLSERFNSFAIILIGTLASALFILLFSLKLPLGWYPLIITMMGLFGSGCIVNQNLLMTRLGNHLGRGEVFGILMGVMTLTSAFSPALFGLTIDLGGLNRGLIIFTIPLVISSILVALLLKNDLHRSMLLQGSKI